MREKRTKEKFLNTGDCCLNKFGKKIKQGGGDLEIRIRAIIGQIFHIPSPGRQEGKRKKPALAMGIKEKMVGRYDLVIRASILRAVLSILHTSGYYHPRLL